MTSDINTLWIQNIVKEITECRISHNNTNIFHVYGGSKFLCNVATYIPNYTLSNLM